MIKTKHIIDRMNQRGINSKMIELVLEYGVVKKDKIILDKKNLSKVLKEIDYFRKDLLKVMDKKGLVVVADNEYLITTYNR